ncbi:MAG: septum formation inhibitor Maf [Eubacteriales bacterium]|nr:septum formation inhibitor Maf [Eubacteriales bacterium]
MEKIILASASPRRSEILKNVGLRFEVVVSDADESSISPEIGAELYVQELALLKAAAAAKRLENTTDEIVISADTVVVSEGNILGKPTDKDEAIRMLESLSGREHSVITGICVFRLKDGFSVCDSVTTKVKFKNLSREVIDLYVSTKESMDKAGAYGIQGKGALLCEKIDGDYFNVVGLPVSRLSDILRDEFCIEILKNN